MTLERPGIYFSEAKHVLGLIDPREVQASRAISGSNADPEHLSANAIVG